MKKKIRIAIGLAVIAFFLVVVVQGAFAQTKAPDSTTLKLEGAKMAPVPFSHPLHTEKAKTDCAVCHHKDKNAKEPAGCVPCHDLKDKKNGAPTAKEAYHKNCIDCHKEAAGKGVAGAPVKCNGCHKKQ